MSTVLPDDLDRRLAAELVPQCPAPPRRRHRTAALTAAPAADPLAAEHRAQLLAALRTTTRIAPSLRETAA